MLPFYIAKNKHLKFEAILAVVCLLALELFDSSTLHTNHFHAHLHIEAGK